MRTNEFPKMLAVVLVTAVVVVTAPVAARTVTDYAKNSDKVDGRHAVGSAASRDTRARKLVATNREGFLPNDIIRKAPNAAALGGRSADRYAAKCEEGALAGAVSVPADLSAAWTEVGGYVLVHQAGGPPPGVDNCERNRPQARRVGEGSYELKLSGEYAICAPEAHVPAVVTVRSESPVFATQSLGCAENFTTLRVRTWTPQGESIDAAVDVAILSPVRIPLP